VTTKIYLEEKNKIILGINFVININIKSQRVLHEPRIDFTNPWDFFDGAYQGSPKMCGDGVILFLDHYHFFSLKYGAGLGANNMVEFYTL